MMENNTVTKQAKKELVYSGYQGDYVASMSAALVASAVSGLHAIVLSPPGWGKTQVARQIAERMVPDNFVFVRLDPTSGPEKVEGLPDPAKALGSPPVYELVVKGTARDPDAQVVIVDEVYRANDAVLDILLDLLDQQISQVDDAAVIWATSNFTLETKRNLALADRFSMYIWVNTPTAPDIAAIAYAHMNDLSHNLELPDGIKIPDWEQVKRVRTFVPTDGAKMLVSDFLQALAKEAVQSGFIPNPRRVGQWAKGLYRYSAYLLDTPDIKMLPDEAVRVLEHMWPTFQEEDHTKWRRVVTSISNTAQVAVDAVIERAFLRFKALKAQYEGGDANDMSREFGNAMRVAKENLYGLGDPDSQVIRKALNKLTEGFAAIMAGRDV